MPKGAFLQYPIESAVVDAVAEAADRHRRARDTVNEQHQLSASCGVDLTSLDYVPTLTAYPQRH
ncbi:MAG: hypothetical protein HYU56_01205 [Candidatus Aenigmarchaeota archaeon]|nr:hypothetical protein [Candidatus Aenigmarchaeota archaeon]